MFKLRRYLAGHYAECVLAPLFKMLEALLQLLVPLVMAQVIDVGIATRDVLLRALARRAARGHGRLRLGDLGHGAVLLLQAGLRLRHRPARRPLPPRAQPLARRRGAPGQVHARHPHHQRLPAGAGRPQHVLQAHPALALRDLRHRGRGLSRGRRRGGGAARRRDRLGRRRHGLHARDHEPLPRDPAGPRRRAPGHHREPRGRARAARLPPRGRGARRLLRCGRHRARPPGLHGRRLRPREPAHLPRHQLRPHRPAVVRRPARRRRPPHAGAARGARELREPGARGAPQAHEPHRAALQGLGLRQARERGLRDAPLHGRRRARGRARCPASPPSPSTTSASPTPGAPGTPSAT